MGGMLLIFQYIFFLYFWTFGNIRIFGRTEHEMILIQLNFVCLWLKNTTKIVLFEIIQVFCTNLFDIPEHM